jgi:hypothetical protein
MNVLYSHRSEDPEANLAESQEFLSSMEDKKTTGFTDVSHTNRVL